MKPRILVIEPAGNLWGSERALLDLIDSMRSSQIAVCCPPDTPIIAELASRGVQVLPDFIADLHLKSRLRRLFAAVRVLVACLRFKPDVIYLNQSGSYRVCLPAASLLRLPIVAHVRIFDDIDYLARQRPTPLRLSGVVAISAAIERAIADEPVLKAITRHMIYDAYSPGGPLASAERAQSRVACVGRITPVKGQDLLIAALEQNRGRALGTDYIIAGGGDPAFTEDLRIRSKALHVPVEWPGVLNDVQALLVRCGVLACPSRREPLGRVIFEAWDAGAVPVVFAGSGGAAEVVAASGGGVIFDEETPKSLADALAHAVALSESEVAVMVRRGREWMAANNNPEAYGRAMDEIFSAASSGRFKAGGAPHG